LLLFFKKEDFLLVQAREVFFLEKSSKNFYE